MVGILRKTGAGYLHVRLVGTSPERFLNLCRNRNIFIWNISCKENQYEFCIGIDDYKALRPVVRKTKTMPYIKEKIGLPFFLSHWLQRKGFVGGLFLFVGLICLLSQMLWSVEITGVYTHTKPELLKFLNKNQIQIGMRMNKIRCTALEETIRKSYDDIGWVSAQIDGSKLVIQIKETNMPVVYQQETIPVHLVASKDGVIASVITRSGVPLVKAGTEVKEGDILISGVVDILGDGDLLLRREPVVADGDIMLETTYDYYDEKNLNYIGKEYTGRIKRRVVLEVFGKRMELLFPINFWQNFEKSDEIVENHDFSRGLIQEITQREYFEVGMVYSKEEVKDTLLKKFIRYSEKIGEKGVIIKKNNVKIRESGQKIITSGTLIVQEPVTTHRKILDSEWRSIPEDEHSGNDN